MSFWFIQQFSIWYVTRFWRRWVGCGRYCCWSSVSHMSSLDVPHVSSCDLSDVTSPLTLAPRLWWWLFDIDSLLVTLPPHTILALPCNWMSPCHWQWLIDVIDSVGRARDCAWASHGIETALLHFAVMIFSQNVWAERQKQPCSANDSDGDRTHDLFVN